MPVDDHPVHPKTIQGAGFRYACHNHKRGVSSYWAPNRIYLDDGRFISTQKKITTEWIEYQVCPAASDHPGCDGCCHKKQPCTHLWEANGFDQYQNSVMRCVHCGKTKGGKHDE